MATRRRAAVNTALDSLATKKPSADAAPSTPDPSPTVAPAPKTDDRTGQTLRLNKAARRQLKLLAVDDDAPVHDLLIEALNDFFRKRGKPPLA